VWEVSEREIGITLDVTPPCHPASTTEAAASEHRGVEGG
jgi:hypothetical protein